MFGGRKLGTGGRKMGGGWGGGGAGGGGGKGGGGRTVVYLVLKSGDVFKGCWGWMVVVYMDCTRLRVEA